MNIFTFIKGDDYSAFVPQHTLHFKDLLLAMFGQNVPSWVMVSKSNLVCDKNTMSWRSETDHDTYGQIAHYCVDHFFNEDVVGGQDRLIRYDWEKTCTAISKLSFVKSVKAVPWTSDTYANFFVVNKKKLKSWFSRNRNRLLLSKKDNLKVKQINKQRSIAYDY